MGKKFVHFMMIIMVITWGLEYVVAKCALDAFDPLFLIFLKYIIGIVPIAIIAFGKRAVAAVRKKDIPKFVVCALFGDVLYFFCEYHAMNYVPVALITIMLGFIPIVSVVVERILYKHKIGKMLVLGMLACLIGVVLVIGADFSVLKSGRLFGYLFCFGAIGTWTTYNFVTADLSDKYGTFNLTLHQTLFAILLTLPYALFHLPPISAFTAPVMMQLLYLGLVSAGVGFLIEVYGIAKLGPTTAAVYSNFLPVSAAVFGWIFLGEQLSIMQYCGGTLVIIAGYFVIREKDKLDRMREPADAGAS